jgi:hypothetical protein
MGFEPTTPTLARLCSTPELHPHPRRVKRPSAPLGVADSAAKLCQRAQTFATAPVRHYYPGQREMTLGCLGYFALAFCLGMIFSDLASPAEAPRGSMKPRQCLAQAGNR